MVRTGLQDFNTGVSVKQAEDIFNRKFVYPDFILSTEETSGFDSKFAYGIKEVFPLLFLGAQTLFVFVEPAAHCSGLLGSQIQGLVLLTLEETKE